MDLLNYINYTIYPTPGSQVLAKVHITQLIRKVRTQVKKIVLKGEINLKYI